MTTAAKLIDFQASQLSDADWMRLRDDITDRMLADATLSATGLRVGLVLLRHLNRETGLAWPGTARIAERIGRPGENGERMVRRALKELVERGHWRTVQTGGPNGRGTGRTTRYGPSFTRTQESPSEETIIRTPESVYPDSPVRFTGTQESPKPLKRTLRKNSSPTPEDDQAKEPGRGGESDFIDPVEAPSSTTTPEVPQLAAFVSRRFRIHRDDAPAYVAHWQADLGDELTRELVHRSAAANYDRDQLLAFMADQLRQVRTTSETPGRAGRRQEMDERRKAAETLAEQKRQAEQAARYAADPVFRLITDFSSPVFKSATRGTAWSAFLPAAIDAAGETPVREWHRELEAAGEGGDWLPILRGKLEQMTGTAPA